MHLKLGILFLLFNFATYSQNNIREWTAAFNTEENLEAKKEFYLKITNHYNHVEKNNDSLKKYLDIKIPVTGDSLFYAEIILNKAIYNNNIANYTTAIENAKTASTLFDKYNKPYKNALTKRLLGNMFLILFKNKQALLYFNQADKILKGKDRINLLSGFGAVYTQLNDLERAIHYYNEAYKAAINYDDSKQLFNIYNGMASVYAKNNDPKQVKESLKKALKEAKKRNYNIGEFVSLQNLGHQYQIEKKYKEAKNYFEQAIEIANKTDNDFLTARVYNNYADCLLNLGDIEKATIYVEKSILILKNMDNTGRLPFALLTKAAIERTKGNNDLAIKILKEALTIASKNEISSAVSKIYLELATVYTEMNDAKKSFTAFNNHIKIKDSLANISKSNEIEKVKAKFEVSELEYKLKQDVILLSEKNKSSYYRNFLLAFIVIGLLFFIYRQRKINKSKQQSLTQEKEISALNEELLKDKVKHKNNQITEYAILIDERNKFLDTVKEQINTIRDLSEDQNQKRKINDLQYYISDTVSLNKGKVDLDKKTDQSDDQFRFELIKQFPKLTEKEITVMRLLVLNLSSKQIAQKMGITVQSVNNYRGSIRKKIGLPKGENLKQFIQRNVVQ